MIIIPARLNSSRFENKILVDILGLPMVIKTAKQVSSLDKVVIATDSQKVIDLAYKYGFDAVLTSTEHNSGTDRINEAVNRLNLSDDEIIINVQADEPFIEESVVKSVMQKVQEIKNQEDILITSCYKEINSEAADDPNLVKVVLNEKENAIYFSRAKIPYHRDHKENSSYFGHLGIYGFTKKSLNKFCSLNSSKLEDIEKLEQLRAIDNGFKIAMVKVESKSFGIDTKEDLERALKLFK
ncbi:3-deoxy-manno-octulosonate cytidylyltransferase [Aliarcobacter vitoriensis]|uniref:3-deoxy-manno-octulosonate cytidylyltransferase n=1 Tax=Aliarcobacter vitoriensis TaxID=2011099 RepID=A0A366MT12_9BACT|nr:3-deoxy-manno-octulosonate cytidylyltransferase [Aliarcobacter vitoriensis]RBQ29406.1 3-deoxy-manno-octulosonate cytidylyltransferase [Aliarcobacter vitoriensis]